MASLHLSGQGDALYKALVEASNLNNAFRIKIGRKNFRAHVQGFVSASREALPLYSTRFGHQPYAFETGPLTVDAHLIISPEVKRGHNNRRKSKTQKKTQGRKAK